MTGNVNRGAVRLHPVNLGKRGDHLNCSEVMAIFVARPGEAEELRALLADIVVPIWDEQGNL